MAGVFDPYNAILDRIRDQVPTFALVGSPSEIASEDDVLQSLPGCYVMPGMSEPTEKGNPEADGARLKGEDLDWIVLIAVAYPASRDTAMEIGLGELALGVIHALNNWVPPGFAHRIRYRQRSAVEYEMAYATLKMRFTHRKIIA